MSNTLIVVGVDGSDGGRRALRWALRHAAQTGGSVEAVIAWSWDDIDRVPIAPSSPSEARERATKLLEHEVQSALHEWLDTPPAVSRHVVEGRPSQVLIDAAADAAMLVLGSHGHGRMFHLTLGGVSEECIRHGSCPVVVVPVPHPERAARASRRPAKTGADPGKPGPLY
jgi:nucleotide-binding universal stress UspA family protein